MNNTTEHSTEWVDGLPPIGTEAVCAHDGKAHLIVAHDLISQEPMAITVDDSGYWGSMAQHWSPIQSDRDKALAEMNAAYMEGAADHRGGIQAIYDAGYRKQMTRADAYQRLMQAIPSLSMERAEEILDNLDFTDPQS